MKHNPIQDALYRPQNFGGEIVQFTASDFREVFNAEPVEGETYNLLLMGYSVKFNVLSHVGSDFFGTWQPTPGMNPMLFMSGFHITRFDGGAE